jgi:endonuclease-3 related protein
MSLPKELYDKLYAHFGPQHWWPGETPFEVCVGAILTQNTAWTNVEKAIANLKKQGLLDFEKMLAVEESFLAECIRPAGYFNIKAKRLKSFLRGVKENFGDFARLADLPQDRLREALLSFSGVGPETADSMLLYAFDKPSFVVDAYTKRILVRHRLIDEAADYHALKDYFESHLSADVTLYNEYHALIVRTGKELCRKSKPKCSECPLRDFNGGPVL